MSSPRLAARGEAPALARAALVRPRRVAEAPRSPGLFHRLLRVGGEGPTWARAVIVDPSRVAEAPRSPGLFHRLLRVGGGAALVDPRRVAEAPRSPGLFRRLLRLGRGAAIVGPASEGASDSRPRLRGRLRARGGAITLALACLLAGATACGGEAQTPEAAAKAFVEAAQRGDTARLLPMIESTAMSRLQAAAERATHHVGGRRTIAPHEMLQIVDVDPLLRVARVEVLDSDGEAARVRIHGSQDQTADLALVLEDGAWRVKIPTPSTPAASPLAPAPPPPTP